MRPSYTTTYRKERPKPYRATETRRCPGAVALLDRGEYVVSGDVGKADARTVGDLAHRSGVGEPVYRRSVSLSGLHGLAPGP